MRTSVERRLYEYRAYTKTKIIIATKWYNCSLSNILLHKKTEKLQNNRQICSCDMCGNPRHNGWLSNKERLTPAERKQLDKYYQEIQEMEHQ